MDGILVDREKFTLLMGQIIQNEFSPAQQRIFRFEGSRRIDELFDQKRHDLESSRNMFQEKAFHLNEIGEVVKLSIDALNMIVACFSFYLAYSHSRLEEKKELREAGVQLPSSVEAKQRKVELLHALKLEMENQSIPKDVVDKITEKYQKELIDLVEKL